MILHCHMMTFQYVERQAVINAIGVIPSVINWRAAVGAIFIVTDETITSNVLAELLAPRLPPEALFVIAAIDGRRAQGRADADTWNFITNPSWPLLLPPPKAPSLPPNSF